MEKKNVPVFLHSLFDADRELCEIVMQGIASIHHEDGAIPLKYRYLMSMVADGMMNHPDGVVGMANAARQAGASETEIREVMRIIYVSGGMVALMSSIGAYSK